MIIRNFFLLLLLVPPVLKTTPKSNLEGRSIAFHIIWDSALKGIYLCVNFHTHTASHISNCVQRIAKEAENKT